MKLFLGNVVAIFFVVASFSSQAFGQASIWNNNGNTAWAGASNWNNGVPVFGSTADVLPGASGDPSVAGSFTIGGSSSISITGTSNQATSYLLIGNVSDNLGNAATIGSVTINFSSGSALTINGGDIVVSNSTLNFSGNLNLDSGTSIILGGPSNLIPINPGFSIPGAGTMTYNTGNMVGASNAYLEIGSYSAGYSGTFTQSGNSNITMGHVEIGAPFGGGSTGTYNMISSGSLVVLTDFTVGTGTFTQNNSASTVDTTASAFRLGVSTGDSATYLLKAGTLDTSGMYVGYSQNTTGKLTQTGGTFNATTGIIVGYGGSGTYTLSAGTANLQSFFAIGGYANTGAGTFNQSGGNLAVGGVFYVGYNSGTGTGIYNLSGGTAAANGGLNVGSTGMIVQTGGTLTVANSALLDLSHTGGQYNLNGGVLQLGNASLFGTSGEGQLNFGGGRLQIMTSGAFADTVDGTLSGISTIDGSTTSGVTSVTMAGNMSGTGGLSFVGSGATTFQFAGTNTYTGSTAITGGVLSVFQQDITNSSALIANAGGVIELQLGGTNFTYTGSGGISGSGLLDVDYGANGKTLTINNASNFTGEILLGADATSGTLQVFNGTFNDIQEGATGNALTIGGSTGTGTVNLTSASYTGQTFVNSGYTLNAGSLGGDVVNNGTLHTLGTLVAPSTLNIAGALNSTNNLLVYVNGIVPDEYIAAGTTMSNLSGTVTVIGAGTKRYQIVQTTAGDLTVGSLTTNPATTLFSSQLDLSLVSAGQVFLDTTQLPFSGFAVTPNQKAVASVLDPLTQTPPLSFIPMLTVFNNLPANQIPVALEQLTPESLQFPQFIANNNATVLAEKVNGFLGDLRSGYSGLDANGISFSAPGMGSGLGRSMGNLLAYNNPAFHDSAPNGVNYYPDNSGLTGTPSSSSNSSSTSHGGTPNNPSSPTTYDGQVLSDSPIPMRTSSPPSIRTSNFSEFIGGDVVLSDINQMQNMSSNASYTAADIIAGVAFRMTSNLSVGVLFDYTHTNADTDSYGSRTKVDSYTPGVFATFFQNNFYANGLFAFGFNSYSNTRDISFLGETANSSPTGQQFIGNLDFGYDIHVKKDWVITPTLGMTYTHLNVGSYSESGAPLANLNVDSQSSDSFRTRLGGHVLYQVPMGNILLQPTITAMWQHEFLDASGITSNFQSLPTSSFGIQSANPAKDSALLGAGMTATLNNSMALYLNYFADVGQDYLTQSIIGGFKASF